MNRSLPAPNPCSAGPDDRTGADGVLMGRTLGTSSDSTVGTIGGHTERRQA